MTKLNVTLVLAGALALVLVLVGALSLAGAAAARFGCCGGIFV